MLLAKTAEAIYWAGRYLERAEDMARIVAVHCETHFDLPVGEDVGWAPLLAVAGAEVPDLALPVGAGAHRAMSSHADEGLVVRFLLTDRDNPSSILSSLDAARTNLRLARPVVPRAAWEVCNDLWLTLRPGPGGSDPLDGAPREERLWALQRVVATCEHVNGVLWGTMRRDEALAFLRLGQHLERVDIVARVLRARADSLLPSGPDGHYDDARRTAVLRSLSADQPFRRSRPDTSAGDASLRFIVHDDTFPRAVLSCLNEILDLVKGLPCNEAVLAAAGDAALVTSGAGAHPVRPAELVVFASEMQRGLATLHTVIDASYFQRPRIDAGRSAVVAVAGRRQGASPSPPMTPDPERHHPAEGGQTYRVRHQTTYTYAGPVEQSYNEAHLRPRPTAAQRVIAHDVVVDPPPSTWSEHLDPFGNTVHAFVVRGGFDQLTVTATSVVALAGPTGAPHPDGPPWETARRLIDADRRSSSREARRLRSASRLVPGAPELAEYGAVSFTPGRPLVEATADLCGRIQREFTYDPGFTSVTTPLLTAFAARRGVCQDFAHLAVGCLRGLGLAARYVSGYLETVPPPGQARQVGADASHAWASVYIPGWGWLDFDPTNDRIAPDSYVTVAWGRDYLDVSPLRGSVEGGGGSHTLQVEVDVSPVRAESGVITALTWR